MRDCVKMEKRISLYDCVKTGQCVRDCVKIQKKVRDCVIGYPLGGFIDSIMPFYFLNYFEK